MAEAACNTTLAASPGTGSSTERAGRALGAAINENGTNDER